jgi:enolase-phosphatase E1
VSVVSLSALHTRALLLDIEGTTTPVEFVYQVLFPYARKQLTDYLEREWDSEACRAAVARLYHEHALDGDAPPLREGSRQDNSASVASYVRWLMDRDRKSPGLKELQGWIWQRGYRSGELRGDVFADVPRALERWRSAGLDVYIYSSGSVPAQQRLFETTIYGDLTTFIRGYFDTGVGPKTSIESYWTIADRIDVAPDGVLFVSDVLGELDAARGAGTRTALCVRSPTDLPMATTSHSDIHPDIHTFDDIVA